MAPLPRSPRAEYSRVIATNNARLKEFQNETPIGSAQWPGSGPAPASGPVVSCPAMPPGRGPPSRATRPGAPAGEPIRPTGPGIAGEPPAGHPAGDRRIARGRRDFSDLLPIYPIDIIVYSRDHARRGSCSRPRPGRRGRRRGRQRHAGRHPPAPFRGRGAAPAADHHDRPARPPRTGPGVFHDAPGPPAEHAHRPDERPGR